MKCFFLNAVINQCENCGLGVWRTDLITMSTSLAFLNCVPFPLDWWKTLSVFVDIFLQSGFGPVYFMIRVSIKTSMAVLLTVCGIKCTGVCVCVGVESLLGVFPVAYFFFYSPCCKLGNNFCCHKKWQKHSPPQILRSVTMITLGPT